MPIKLKCSCGQTLSVPDNLAGKSGKCPKCQKALQIPSAAPANTASTPAKPAAAKPAAVKPVAAAQAAAQVNRMDSLLDDVGLTKKTGPVCPKCAAPIRPGSVLCTSCGLNFESGELATGFEAAAAQLEFKNEFLQEAAHNMTRDVVMDQRREKSGLPWWMLMAYLIGAMTLCAAGVVIVDGKFNEPAPAGTFLGNIQRLPVLVTLGITAMITGSTIHAFAHLSIVVFAFQQGIGKGFGCLLVPFFSYVYGVMHLADNRQALTAIFISVLTASAGVGLVIAGGGFNTIQAIM